MSHTDNSGSAIMVLLDENAALRARVEELEAEVKRVCQLMQNEHDEARALLREVIHRDGVRPWDRRLPGKLRGRIEAHLAGEEDE